MNTTYEFKVDQRVQMCDGETGDIVIGQVTKVTNNSVFIKWEDLSAPVEHGKEEYHLIQLTK